MPSVTHIDRPSSPGMSREETKEKAETFIKTGKSAYIMMNTSTPALLVPEEAGRRWLWGSSYGSAQLICRVSAVRFPYSG